MTKFLNGDSAKAIVATLAHGMLLSYSESQELDS